MALLGHKPSRRHVRCWKKQTRGGSHPQARGKRGGVSRRSEDWLQDLERWTGRRLRVALPHASLGQGNHCETDCCRHKCQADLLFHRRVLLQVLYATPASGFAFVCFSSPGRSEALCWGLFCLVGRWSRPREAHRPREAGGVRPEPAVARGPWWKEEAKIVLKEKAKIGPPAAAFE